MYNASVTTAASVMTSPISRPVVGDERRFVVGVSTDPALISPRRRDDTNFFEVTPPGPGACSASTARRHACSHSFETPGAGADSPFEDRCSSPFPHAKITRNHRPRLVPGGAGPSIASDGEIRYSPSALRILGSRPDFHAGSSSTKGRPYESCAALRDPLPASPPGRRSFDWIAGRRTRRQGSSRHRDSGHRFLLE